ncbi:MAG: aminoacyl-tRNA hydrolase, partial [Patescibacteria group bacterium]
TISRQLTVDSRQLKLHNTSIFMNESGKEVKELITNYSLPTTNLLVVHDDLDLDPGKWKLQFNRSAAGHKGVQSVIDELGTQEFWRLRIGVGKPPAGKTADSFDVAQNRPERSRRGDQFVVEKPTKEEQRTIEQAIAESIPRVLEWARAL